MSSLTNLFFTSAGKFPIVKERLHNLHHQLQRELSDDILLSISQGYQEVCAELNKADLNEFAVLAKRLADITLAMTDNPVFFDQNTDALTTDALNTDSFNTDASSTDILSAKVLNASEILLQELLSLADKGTYQQSQINEYCQQLEQLMTQNETEPKQINDELSGKLNDGLSDESNDELSSELNDDELATSQLDTNPSLQLLYSNIQDNDIPDDDEDCDSEIKEIFVEEAQEVLDAITELMPQLNILSSTKEPLTTVRRGFHTLKGSGRMAGAHTSAELAWAIENMLNRVLEGTIQPTAGMQQLLQDIVTGYPALIDVFEQDGDYPEQMRLWMTAANIYAKNQHPEFDYLDVIESQSKTVEQANTEQDVTELSNVPQPVVDEEPSVSQLDQEPDSQLDPELDHELDSQLDQELDPELNKLSDASSTEIPKSSHPANAIESDLLEDLASANARLKQVAHDPELVSFTEETELQELFFSEAGELLATIDKIIGEMISHQLEGINDELVRAFHTLHGAASSQSLDAISDISATAEHSLEQLQQQDGPITDSHLQLISQSVELIKLYITNHINKLQNNASKSQSTQMQQDLSLLQDAFESSLKEETESQNAQPEVTLSVAELIDGIDDLLDADWQLQQNLSAFQHTDDGHKQLVSYFNKLSQQGQKLLSKVSESPKFVTVLNALIMTYQSVCHAPDILDNKKLIDALVAVQEQLTGLFDSLAGSMTLKVNDTVIDQLQHLVISTGSSKTASNDVINDSSTISDMNEDVTESLSILSTHFGTEEAETQDLDVDHYSDHVRQQEALEITQDNTPAEESPADESMEVTATEDQQLSLPVEVIDIDEEMLTIFVEEAQELNEDSNRQFIKWHKAPENKAPVKVLLRHLHTIKGGANMAGIESIAELSHEAETLYEYLVSGKIEATASGVAVMQSVQDILSNQIERLVTDRKSFYVPTVIEQLRTLAKAKSIPPDYQLQVPVEQALRSQDTLPVDDDGLSKPIQPTDETITLGTEQTEANELEATRDLTKGADSKDLNLSSFSKLSNSSNVSNLSNVSNSQSDDVNAGKEQSQSAVTDSTELDLDAALENPTLGMDNISSIELDFDRMKSESWEGLVPDPDILTIYLEEADELLNSIDKHFNTLLHAINNKAINSNEEDLEWGYDAQTELLKDLHRELHMFKGGAHMAYAYATADVAEALQSAYSKLEKQHSQVFTTLTSTSLPITSLQVAHNWLNQAVYLLHNGINPPPAQALITTLETLAKDPQSLKEVPNVSLTDYVEAVDRYEAWREARLGLRDISEMPTCITTKEQPEEQVTSNNEMIRVSTRLMEKMINLSGESSISCSRIERSMSGFGATLNEMGTTVKRLAEQLRRMDIELEAQIRSQIDDKNLDLEQGFDPLEMDQYSALNQLSKSLAESASDLLDIKTTLYNKTQDTESLLLQLSQSQAQLQQGLMTSRMVPFSRLSSRLQRTVRQTANELGKSVELVVINEHDEIDRTILERITSPLEHMIRNAVDHGIESPDVRKQKGKPPKGKIVIDMTREGSEIVIRLKDDGQGIDVESVRRKAVSRGLISADDKLLTDLDIVQYIFHAGLSTARNLTQISGRGVGMDVVLSEVRQLGGSVSAHSDAGQGTEFILRLPLTIAVADALVVRAGDQTFAIPLLQIERIERIDGQSLLDFYNAKRDPNSVSSQSEGTQPIESHAFNIGGSKYRLGYLTEMLLGMRPDRKLIRTDASAPVILIKNPTGQNFALHVDDIVGSRVEVVVKPLSRPLSSITGLSAATITGDGSVVLILDALALMRNAPSRDISAVSSNTDMAQRRATPMANKTTVKPKILIVDDSVTVRKVTSRILERQGYQTYVARDGVEAVELLENMLPDLMLLDIEMPRMDGFEVAAHVRHNSRLSDLPIVMITSRTGEKHRQRALQLGVNDYMGKPFQEAALISTIQALIGQTSGDNSG